MARQPKPYALAVEVGNTAVFADSCEDPPTSDELILSIGHISYGGKTALLSRSKVQEIHNFLGDWLAKGWPGVPQVDGESNADVVRHYEDIAIRERINADHARIDAARQVAAALACIPPERRPADLEDVAREQATYWVRLQQQHDALEAARSALIALEFATDATADQLRSAAGKVVEKVNRALDKAHNVTDAKVTAASGQAPIYLAEPGGEVA
jgi:hypothetical protein